MGNLCPAILEIVPRAAKEVTFSACGLTETDAVEGCVYGGILRAAYAGLGATFGVGPTNYCIFAGLAGVAIGVEPALHGGWVVETNVAVIASPMTKVAFVTLDDRKIGAAGLPRCRNTDALGIWSETLRVAGTNRSADAESKRTTIVVTPAIPNRRAWVRMGRTLAHQYPSR